MGTNSRIFISSICNVVFLLQTGIKDVWAISHVSFCEFLALSLKICSLDVSLSSCLISSISSIRLSIL